MKMKILGILLVTMALLSTSVLAIINTDTVTATGNTFKVGEEILITGTAYSNTHGFFPYMKYTLTTDEGKSFTKKARGEYSIDVNNKISFNTPGIHYANINFVYTVTAYNSAKHTWEFVTETAQKSFVFNIEANEPENQAPTANFDYSCNNLNCNFYSTATDSDGVISSVNWNFGDGATETISNPTHVYAQNGTYAVTLTVTDNDGATDCITKQVTVTSPVTQPQNKAPTASFKVEQLNASTYTFTSTSADVDGTITGYEWRIDEGNVLSTSKTFTHTFTDAGTYTVVLTVTDNEGATDSAAYVVRISASNNNNSNNNSSNNNSNNNQQTTDVITINAGGTVTTYVNTPVEFTGAATDSDGYISIYAWDFDGDGTYDVESINPITANYTYTTPGVYTAVFKVVDNKGRTKTANRTIIVGEEYGVPVVNAGQDMTAKTLQIVNFLGTATDNDGRIVKYEWDFDYNSTKGFVPEYTSTRDGTASHIYYKAGVYTAALRVTDNDGKTATDYVKVTVTGESINSTDVSGTKRYDFRFSALDVKRTSQYNFNDATTTVELKITNLDNKERTFLVRDVVPKSIATYYDDFQVLPKYDIVYNTDPELGWNITVGAYETATIKYTFYKFVSAENISNWDAPTIINENLSASTNTTTEQPEAKQSAGLTGLVIGAMNASGISLTALIIIIILAVALWKKEYIIEKIRSE